MDSQLKRLRLLLTMPTVLSVDIQLLRDALTPTLALVDQLAACQTDDDQDGDMSGDDAIDALGGFVHQARALSDARPDQAIHPEAPFLFVSSTFDKTAFEKAMTNLREAIAKANRQLIDELLGYEASFKLDRLKNPCPACKGDGELTEYPPDDDERMVACIHCGGTGERT